MADIDINIFEYTNYRDLLRDYYEKAKVEKNGFSHRTFAKKADFSSPSFLKMIISGARNLSKDFVPKFSSAMGLTKKEQHYFEMLVSFNHAKTPEAKRYYLELIYGLKKEKAGVALNEKQFHCLSKWYYIVIRELVALPDFSEDPSWIKERLRGKVTAKQITDAIEALLAVGLLTRDYGGKLHQTMPMSLPLTK